MAQNLGLPQVIQSDQVTFQPGGTVTIKKDFLEPCLAMSAPVMRKALLRCQLVVSVGATEDPSTVNGGMLTHFISKFIMKDRSGERINVSGAELRVIAQSELGLGYLDQPPLASGVTTNLAVEFYIPLILTRGDKASSPDDTGVVLPDFYSGGEITMNFVAGNIGPGNAGPAELEIVSGQVSVIAEVIDEGTPEAKARLAWLSQSLLNNDSSYPLNGKLSTGLLYIGDVNEEAGTVWATAGQTLESRSLNYIALPQPSYVERYIEEGYNDVVNDTIINGFTLPFYVPHRGAKIVRQPVFANFHVKFSQALPQGATFLTGQFTQRSSESIALSFRNVPPQQLAAAVQSGGTIPGNSGTVSAMAMPASQRRYLPMRLGPLTAAGAPPVTPVGQATR